jgi:pyridoxal/pyridoxine/pyridoxamine kinase
LAAVTSSGIQIKSWVTRLTEAKTARGYVRGPLFGDDAGLTVKAKIIELELMDHLQNIKDTQPGLITGDLDFYEDFGISHLF